MALGTAAAIGLGLAGAGSVAGSAIQAGAQDRATDAAIEAAQFRPFDIFTPGGSAAFNTQTDSVTASSPQLDQFGQLLQQNILGALDPSALSSRGFGLIPSLQNFSLEQLEGVDPNADLDAALGLRTDATGLLSGQLGGLQAQLSGLAGNSLGISEGASVFDPFAQFALGRGQELLQSDSQSVVDQTLQRLRNQARPAEERAVDSTVQSLFSRGVLGGTQTDRTLGELSLSQELADIQRQQVAEQVGLSRFQANQSAGQSLFGQGLGALGAGRDERRATANLFGNLGLQSLGQQRGLFGDQFAASTGLADFTASRGQQRLANLQNLFNFGQQAEGAQLQQGLAGISGQLQLNQDLRNLIALGGNLGGQQQVASGQIANAILAGAQSPFGAGLSTLSEGLLTGILNSGG
ncbi:MAG: hypothetical protein QNJ97_17875 [Myxococcota bacterium]|nr:hypothetical protein [Myxococcota bacterium]